MSGEAASRAHLDLPGNQQALLETIVAAGKPVVTRAQIPLTFNASSGKKSAVPSPEKAPAEKNDVEKPAAENASPLETK